MSAPDHGAARAAAAVAHSEDAVVHTTLDGRIVEWNDAATELFGFTATQACGRPLGMLYPIGAWAGAGRYADELGPGRTQREIVMVHASGRSLNVRATLFRVPGPDGEPVGLGAIYRALGAQQRTQRMLLSRDALAGLLQALVKAANDAETPQDALAEGLRLICQYGAWQLGHAVIFAPQAARRVPTLALWHADDESRYAEFIERAGRFDYSGARRAFLGRVFSSGGPVWVSDIARIDAGDRTGTLLPAGIRSAFAFPVTVAGEILALLEFFGSDARSPDSCLLESIGSVSQCFARMIERHGASAEKARLAAVVEGANDAIIERSIEGIITTWNPSAQRLLGYTAEDAIGQPMSMTLPARRRYLVEANNQLLLRGEPVAMQESPRLRKDGSIVHVSANVSPVKDPAGKVIGAAVFLRDISETVRNREHLVRKVQVNGLMQSLARTANEAATPDAALHACLRLIAEYGKWDVARLVQFGADGSRSVSSLFQMDYREAQASLPELRDSDWTAVSGEAFIPGLAAAQDAVWLESTQGAAEGDGLATLRSHDMTSAFGFPVVSGSQTVALLEFFSRAPRPVDHFLLENAVTIAAQLARVAERHRYVADIARSEQRLRAILDHEPACVTVIDRNGALLDMNRAGLRFLDVTSIEEARVHRVIDIAAPDYRQRFVEMLERTIGGEKCDLEFEIIGLKGSRRWVECHTAPFTPEDGGAVAMLAVIRDVTDRKRAEERVAHFAHHDPLTGLPNRSLFQDRVGVAVAHARRRAEAAGVMIVAIDRFRKVNESFGYDVGDELLRRIAARITEGLREVDTLARLGADQFAILVEGSHSLRDLAIVAEKIQGALATPFLHGDSEIFLTASIGIASYPAHAADAHALLEAVERAMNRVKEEGGAGYFCSEGPRRAANAAEFSLESGLRNALRLGELSVHYQPKIDLRTGGVTGAEALLRWTNPALGSVSPARFIPIAEETGLIESIGGWVLETACAQAAAWYRQHREINISVNLSPRQFRQADLPALVARALADSGLPAGCLELEITESTAMSNPTRAAQILAELHALGVKLSVDDFGTGYSSLSYLRQFPLDCLKIDRSFVRDISTSSSDEAIVRATIALAHSLQLEVVGEGIETDAQHARLTELGCDFGQGYLYGAAVPPAQFESILARSRESPIRSTR